MKLGGQQDRAGRGGAPAPRRILLVDDDPLILKAMRMILESDGHAVTPAQGGEAAILLFLRSVAERTPFPVVMTDLSMPHVDGLEVATAVKARAPDTLVLLLTGCSERLRDRDVPFPQFDLILGKPPMRGELRDALLQAVVAEGP